MITTNFQQVAVWLDHAKALFIGHHDDESFFLETINSPYKRLKREDGEGSSNSRMGKNVRQLTNNEFKKHNISQNEMNDFFKTLETKLSKYKEILLFGPTNAKEQLYNRISDKKQFKGVAIDVRSADEMTIKQLLAYVNEFFNH